MAWGKGFSVYSGPRCDLARDDSDVQVVIVTVINLTVGLASIVRSVLQQDNEYQTSTGAGWLMVEFR